MWDLIEINQNSPQDSSSEGSEGAPASFTLVVPYLAVMTVDDCLIRLWNAINSGGVYLKAPDWKEVWVRADLPLSGCAPTADVEQEKKSTDDCQRLHLCRHEKRLYLCCTLGFCSSRKEKKRQKDKNRSNTKHAGFHGLSKSPPGGEKNTLLLSMTVHLECTAHNIPSVLLQGYRGGLTLKWRCLVKGRLKWICKGGGGIMLRGASLFTETLYEITWMACWHRKKGQVDNTHRCDCWCIYMLGILFVHFFGSLCFDALIVVGINSSDNCGSRTCVGLLLGYTTLFDVFLTGSMWSVAILYILTPSLQP